MELEHAAILTRRIEDLKDFYVRLLDGEAGGKYVNRATGFESYFVRFGLGARLEIMSRPGLAQGDAEGRTGIAHLAFAVDSCEEVDRMAERFRISGVPILRGPRVTGDRYYEFEATDPEGNRLEVTYGPLSR